MAERPDLTPQPLQAIAGFAARLREQGFRVGIPEQQAMLQAALSLGVGHHRQVEACWRSVVCGDADEWRRYPELFAHYWFPERFKGSVRARATNRPRRDLRQLIGDLHAAADGGPAPGSAVPGAGGREEAAPQGDAEHAQGGASRSDSVDQRDFREWQTPELGQLERIVEDLARRMRARLTRRRRLDARGRQLDLRKTLRRSLRTGGIPFEPAWLKRRREPPRLFILVDVSRSMELYARLFLHIARAFAAVLRARVFVFHTHLAEVTTLLRHPSRDAQEKIAAVAAGFGGGTRIAASLENFATIHARGALSRAARVMVMSDGFDSDDADALRRALAAIRARGARIYWLHPSRDVPQASALAPCFGIISAFAPVYNVESLSHLDILIS
ncbi:MAG: VWA domain-containing protein [Hyphomicrobiaceae bacterium]